MKNLLAAAAVAVLPLIPTAASAVTVPITGPGFDSFANDVTVGSTLVYSFEVTSATPLTFSFAVSGSGLSDSLPLVTFAIDGATPVTWSAIDDSSVPAGATGSLPTFTTSSNFTITFFSNAAPTDVSTTLTYAAVAAVPAPAALPLLGAGLAAFGVVATRRRRKAANNA